MKKIVCFFVCVLGITNIILSQSKDHDKISSKLELFMVTITEFSDSNIHWEKYGTDSKVCYLQMNDQKYAVVKVGMNDCLNGGIYGEDKSFGIPVGINAMVINETKKKEATVDEIGDLLNWQKAKGFYWDNKEKINKVPRTYAFTVGDIYDITFQKPFDSSLTEIMDVMSGKWDEFTKDNVHYPSKDFKSNVYYQSNDAIGYAYSIWNKSMLFFVKNDGNKEIMIRFFEGTKDRAYSGIRVAPAQARLIVVDVPETTINNTEVMVNITPENVEVIHIGEKITMK